MEKKAEKTPEQHVAQAILDMRGHFLKGVRHQLRAMGELPTREREAAAAARYDAEVPDFVRSVAEWLFMAPPRGPFPGPAERQS